MKSMPKAIEFLTHLIHRYFIWMIVASYFLAALLPGLGIMVGDFSGGRGCSRAGYQEISVSTLQPETNT
ncbi:MAG: hypothetical protein CTY17_10610 [Methylomonas sp.]|nr:MAG: hypothetical protein CTY23_10710 [Methylomonas sp.]PPD37706.1 MAG: hypothetical protein CTY17_10610 [Methylomonas sp.]PPD55888.1 MAG: hypothetical protein CTY11_00520 [Methylomonas sp.]